MSVSAVDHVVLLGLMGVGKSTVGQELANALGWPFDDSDVTIAKAGGETVRQLSERLGVEEMHRIEAEHLLAALMPPEPSVVAAAASVVEDPRCREALARPDVFTVWLDAGADTLVDRFAGGPHRPLLESDEYRLFRRQHTERSRWYAEVARLRVSVEGLRPEQIVAEILDAVRAS
jgi:shikimate kinase